MIFRSFGHFLEFSNYFKSRKSITASALRLGDVSRVNRPVQVKPDQWDPLVSDPETLSVTDRWVRSTAMSAGSTLTGGATVIS